MTPLPQLLQDETIDAPRASPATVRWSYRFLDDQQRSRVGKAVNYDTPVNVGRTVDSIKISSLSQRTGVPTRLRRYYEEQDLLHPTRLTNGYRDFDECSDASPPDPRPARCRTFDTRDT
ncbi:MerR family DNA-binding transcriptional regulator [Rhodococcus koreensis]|uniref:MerR family DNA-binding transcriptional regulator n=1 Tax=Rhodococcus koreensis TaxID=99653 RepID=UPI001F1267DD|nr:MerR family DNA-binding transcriptional regulator [Rhodococcus koreensis]